MVAKPYLDRIAEQFASVNLDAVMIGNAAAAINGAPVTTGEASALWQDLPKPERVDDDPDRHLIRLQLAKPPHERTHFLRIPLANGGSCI